MNSLIKTTTLPALAIAVSLGMSVSMNASTASAAWKPTKKVEISVTCKPGCGPDRIARMIQKIWKTEGIVEQDVIVHNKSGGGGAIQLNYINSHPGDGHYLGVGSASALTTYLTGRTKIGIKQMTPLVVLVTEYIVTAVKGDSPIKDAKDLLARIKADPQSISIGTATSRGNANHQAISMAALRAGIDPKKLKFVIFQSGRIGRTNLLGGHVQVAQSSAGGFLKHHKKGKLRILAVSSPTRLGGPAKNVPTWKESGLDVEVGNFRSMFGPKGLNKDQIKYWEDVFKKTVKSKTFQKSLKKRQMKNTFMDHKTFMAFLVKKEKQMREVLGALGILKN
ncbi:MAG: Bug family tripartite tricarboxylate transporter substrate binding protein [Rhodospirillales bacterium]|jgi:putative tricarboxylic transport membrane protein